MDMAEYRVYRHSVLLKANGADIHELNGALGRVMNTIGNFEYWETQNGVESEAELEKNIRMQVKAKEDIQKLINK